MIPTLILGDLRAKLQYARAFLGNVKCKDLSAISFNLALQCTQTHVSKCLELVRLIFRISQPKTKNLSYCFFYEKMRVTQPNITITIFKYLYKFKNTTHFAKLT